MSVDEIIKKIRERTSLSEEEIREKIVEKQNELSNLVSLEGAGYIVAKELGIDLLKKEKHKLEIKNIIPGIRNLNLEARIVKIFEREFEKNGKKGKVASLFLSDGTDSIRLSLWDEQTELIKNLEEGKAIKIVNAFTIDNQGEPEIRLGKNGKIILLENSDLPEINEIKIKRSVISEFKQGVYETRALLLQLFESKFFTVCPECGVTIKDKCKEHGEVKPKRCLVVSGIIDDGYSNIRAVFFRDQAEKILENSKNIGKEFVFVGKVKLNKMFDRKEFIVDSFREINVKNEINLLLNELS